MDAPLVVIIAKSDHTTALRKRVGTDHAIAVYADAESLRAIEAIVSRPPKFVALDPAFVTTARGAALVAQVKGDPRLSRIDVSFAPVALFLAAVFCAPLVAAIPTYATAPALILVGALMCGALARVRWNDFTEAFPAFLTLVATPLTFSIATGLSLGLLSFTFLKLGSGRYREITPLIWVLSALFVLRYAFLGAE